METIGQGSGADHTNAIIPERRIACDLLGKFVIALRANFERLWVPVCGSDLTMDRAAFASQGFDAPEMRIWCNIEMKGGPGDCQDLPILFIRGVRTGSSLYRFR